ncbi:MAG: hypothetical protein VZR95_09335 [Alphaproteobacteria bacterium]
MIYAVLWPCCIGISLHASTPSEIVISCLAYLGVIYANILLPLYFSINQVFKIIVTDSDLIICYKHFNTDKTIRLNKKEAKIFFYQSSKGATPYHFTFGQKVHGYNNKVFLTQYLFGDWDNKEKFKEFIKFVEDNNITNNFKQIDWKKCEAVPNRTTSQKYEF